jgi:hypothetical protein
MTGVYSKHVDEKFKEIKLKLLSIEKHIIKYTLKQQLKCIK